MNYEHYKYNRPREAWERNLLESSYLVREVEEACEKKRGEKSAMQYKKKKEIYMVNSG